MSQQQQSFLNLCAQNTTRAAFTASSFQRLFAAATSTSTLHNISDTAYQLTGLPMTVPMRERPGNQHQQRNAASPCPAPNAGFSPLIDHWMIARSNVARIETFNA